MTNKTKTGKPLRARRLSGMALTCNWWRQYKIDTGQFGRWVRQV